MIFSVFLISVLLNPAPAAKAEASLETALSYFETGKYTEAVQTLNAELSQTPSDPRFHYWLTRSYYELQNHDKAVTHAEQAVKLAPQNAEYNRWLGRAYGAKAEQSRSFFLARKVKGAFEAAVRLDPSNIESRRDLMQYYAEAPWIVGGDKQKALQQIEAISALDPLQGRLARAAYYTADKQWKQAEAEYISVLDQHPARIEPYMEAADFFAGRKDPQHLEQVLETAENAKAGDPRLNYYRAVTLILLGNEPAVAEQLLKSYIAGVPRRSDYPPHDSALQWLSRINH